VKKVRIEVCGPGIKAQGTTIKADMGLERIKSD